MSDIAGGEAVRVGGTYLLWIMNMLEPACHGCRDGEVRLQRTSLGRPVEACQTRSKLFQALGLVGRCHYGGTQFWAD